MGFVIFAGLFEQACVSADKAVHAPAKLGNDPIIPDKNAIDAGEASGIEERWG
jgi:hypothetical protein